MKDYNSLLPSPFKLLFFFKLASSTKWLCLTHSSFRKFRLEECGKERPESHDFLGGFFLFLNTICFPVQEVVIKAGCVTSAHLHAGDLFFCFLLKILRLGEYSLMKHLVLCKFLLMADKNVFRAWYTLDSKKASSRFLD